VKKKMSPRENDAATEMLSMPSSRNKKKWMKLHMANKGKHNALAQQCI
jgi:hypothetical protein